MPGPTTPHPSQAPRAPGAAPPVVRLHRPAARRAAAVAAEERAHAGEVVAHLLHREWGQWSWTAHAAAAHREEASDIVDALCREGWGPGPSAA